MLVLLTSANLFAQQEAMVSQYMFNGLYINPAYAGSQENFSTTMLFRKQWVRFDGAPSTFTASVDGPLANNKMGIGFTFSHDQIGVQKQTDFGANYSYNIKLGQGKLAFGIRAGLSTFRASVSELTYWDLDDPIYSPGDIKGVTVPRFGFGIYYFVKDKWYAGFSIPTLMGHEKGLGFSMNIDKSSYLRRHYMLTGGYVFSASENIKLKPSVLFKYIPSAPFQADINFSVMFKDMICAGLSFRTGDALVAMIEYQASNSFRIGYGYDITVSKLRNYSSGSHEIMIGYDFGKENTAIKTPRYF